MIKELLKEKETVAYLSLKNDLKNHHLAHSYLLYGELNPLKKDTAFLLAQSIIEDSGDFACEECATCKRIKNNEYVDLYFIDGHKNSIKKEQIEDLMAELRKTPLEKANKKIYIIDNINNASVKALNTLLKILEEPSSKDCYAIFITNKKEDLLSTIVSRCLEVPFLTRDFSEVIDEYMNHDIEYLDAYLLTQIHHEFNEEIIDNIDIYQEAKNQVFNTIDNLNNKDYLPVIFSQEIYNTYKGDELKTFSDYYIDIMTTIVQDSFSSVNIENDLYIEKLETLNNYDKTKLFEIFQEAKDKLLYNPERKLLFDSIAFAIISYI